MKRRIGAAALAGLLAIAGGLWLMTPHRKNAAPPARTKWNPTHERAFLEAELRRNPTHAPILLRLAQIERSVGNLQGARQHLERAIAARGNQVDVRLELGLVCSLLSDFPAAEEQNRAVLKLDPRQADALYNLGAPAANRGDWSGARNFWSDAARTGSTDGAARAREAVSRLMTVR